jgi:hypothetical protein
MTDLSVLISSLFKMKTFRPYTVKEAVGDENCFLFSELGSTTGIWWKSTHCPEEKRRGSRECKLEPLLWNCHGIRSLLLHCLPLQTSCQTSLPSHAVYIPTEQCAGTVAQTCAVELVGRAAGMFTARTFSGSVHRCRCINNIKLYRVSRNQTEQFCCLYKLWPFERDVVLAGASPLK